MNANSDTTAPAAAATEELFTPARPRVNELMAELAAELAHWNSGAHRAIVYPKNWNKPSCIQNLELIPTEDEPAGRRADLRDVCLKVIDAGNLIAEVKTLSRAAHMAMETLPSEERDPLQLVLTVMNSKLGDACDQLDAAWEALS